MKISIIGTRGIPSSYGGFETFAEEISVLLTREGYEVAVQCDKDSFDEERHRGVSLFYSSCTKSSDPLRYYFEGIRWALANSDIVIVTGSVGSIFYFMNLFRKKVLITNTDGIEYKRSKWSFIHRMYLRFSELLAIYLSDIVIADSMEIKNYLLKRYPFSDKRIRVIEYGAWVNDTVNVKILERYNLKSRKYYLVVCRLVPENNLSMIIDGYNVSGSSLPLIIIGQLGSESYVNKLVDKYNCEMVRFLDAIHDKEILGSIRFGCKAYIHGHSVGGTNPSLLEAMASGNAIICHDNRFNREVTDNKQLYFSDSYECSNLIKRIENMEDAEYQNRRKDSVSMITSYYNWENILEKYINLFNSLK